MKVVVSKNIKIEVPSASGLEMFANDLYVVGDDSQWLFQLNGAGSCIKKYPLFDIIDNSAIRVAKKHKADLESLTQIMYKEKPYLLALSSGSKLPERDHFILYDITAKSFLRKRAGKLFDQLQQFLPYEKKINIEASAFDGENIYLFHRGNVSGDNLIFSCKIDLFIDAFLNDRECFFNVNRIKLPALSGIQLGISGATFIVEEGKMFFSATAEDTRDEYNDGKVIGSVIGFFYLNDIDKINFAPICSTNGELLPIKIESIAIKSIMGSNYQIWAVTDDDQADCSDLIELVLINEK